MHENIDSIIGDIKDAHREDSTSAPTTTVAEELKRNLEEVSRFEGSHAEKVIMIFCKQTKLNYNKLTEEEKQWLVRIARRSELLKGYGNKRGKRNH